MKTKNYPHLFTPIKIGDILVPNRIAMVSTDISSANADGSINQRVITSVLEIKKDGTIIIVNSEFKMSAIKVDTVVLAKIVPNDSIYKNLFEAGLNVARIGDAKEIRNIRGAVTDGTNTGLVIEKGVMLNANNELISNLPTGD